MKLVIILGCFFLGICVTMCVASIALFLACLGVDWLRDARAERQVRKTAGKLVAEAEQLIREEA